MPERDPADAEPGGHAPEPDGGQGAGDDRGPGDDHGIDDDALLSRLRLIEDQPLETRADAYAQVHAELRAALESGDAQRPHA